MKQATASSAISESNYRASIRESVTPEPSVIALVLLGVILIVGALSVVIQYELLANGYMTDDAYISFRYAQNMADGLGPVWQSGDRVEGYTNFGWVALLAASERLGVDPVNASRVLGFAFSAGTVALIPLLASQLRVAWTWRWWAVTAGGVGALAANNGFALWTFGGLEVPAVAFFLTAAVAVHLREERLLTHPVGSSLLFVAAALMRPDAVVAVGVCGASKCLRLFGSDRAYHARLILTWALIFAVLFGAFWLWRWNYYGDFFPNTYYLKSGRSQALFERGGRYVRDFFTAYWFWILLPAVVSVSKERLSDYAPATCLLGLITAWAGYVTYVGGDWMPYFRFFVPLLPLMYVLAIHSFIDAFDGVASRFRMSGLAPLAIAGVCALAVFSAVRPWGDTAARNPFSGTDTDPLPGAVDSDTQRTIGLWMRANLPEDFSVAQIATGIVPYYSKLPTIDMLGVNDRHIAHLDLPVGRGPAGHEKEDGGYVVSRRPEIIWLALSLEPIPRSSPDAYMPPIDTRWVPVVTSITQNAYIWLLYRPVAIQLDGGWLNLLVRQDVKLSASD